MEVVGTCDTQEWLATYPLHDGREVRFRHVQPDDQLLIAEAIRTASPETLLHRFFSPIRDVPPDILRKMLEIDRSKGVCIVGEIGNGSDRRIICGARYVRLPQQGHAEIAITVHDDFHHCGLGSFLLKLLMQWARTEGITTFEADVMASNAAMLGLLHKVLATPARWTRDGEIYHVEISVKSQLRI